MRATCECWNHRLKNASVDLGAMPADGFDAAAKKFGTSARPGGSSPRQWMDYTPVVRASEETNQNKPGAVVSVVVQVFGRRQRRDARHAELSRVQKAPRHEVAGRWAPA